MRASLRATSPSADPRAVQADRRDLSRLGRSGPEQQRGDDLGSDCARHATGVAQVNRFPAW
jgi:hypothetical protein